MNWWEKDQVVDPNAALAPEVAQPSPVVANGSSAVNFWESDPIADPNLAPTVTTPVAEAAPAPFLNQGRNFLNRASDIGSGLLTSIENSGDALEGLFGLGGIVPDQNGGFFPDYVGAEEFARINNQEGVTGLLDASAKGLDKFDAGFVPQSDWNRLKASYGDDGLLSLNTLSELGSFGVETGVSSVADMLGMAVSTPLYVGARAGEIGENRAKNNGQTDSTFTDTAIAAPFAIATTALEKIGFNGMTSDIMAKVAGRSAAAAKAASTKGLTKAVAAAASVAAFKESITEFVQEGLIEYLGETAGTDKALSLDDALERGLQGAIGGGLTGGAIGGAVGGVTQNAANNATINNQIQEDAQPEAVISENFTRSPEEMAAIEAGGAKGVDSADAIAALFEQAKAAQSLNEVPQGSSGRSDSDLSGTMADEALGFKGADFDFYQNDPIVSDADKNEAVAVKPEPEKQADQALDVFNSEQNETAKEVERPLIEAKSSATSGKTQTTYTENNDAIETQFEVLSANEVIASNDSSGTVNPNFPDNGQPRERSRAASIAQMNKIERELNPARLGASDSTDGGAPVVNSDGVVESGNGRTAALQAGYRKNSKQIQGYKQYLIDNAEKFGLNADEISKIEQPVLVQRRLNDFTEDQAKQFTVNANKDSKLRTSPAEQAAIDAEVLSDDIISQFNPDESGNVSAATNTSFVNKFMEQVGVNEAGALSDASGRLNRDGVSRITAAIFQKAYNNKELLALQAEDANPDLRNIINGLTKSAGAFARARSSNADITDKRVKNVVDAVALVRESRNKNISTSELVNQTDIFTGDVAAKEVNELAIKIDENIRSSKELGAIFSDIADGTERAANNSKNLDMFDQESVVEKTASVESKPEDDKAVEPADKPAPVDNERRADNDKPNGIFTETSAPQVQTAIDPLIKNWKSGPNIEVVEFPRDLPGKQPSNAAGLWKDGKVYLVAKNIKNPEDAKRVLLHEVIGHDGIRRAFKDMTGSDKIDTLMANVFNSHRAEVVKEAKRRNIKTDSRAGKLVAADEWIARLAETELSKPSQALNQLLAYIKKALRSLGLASQSLSKPEILDMLRQGRKLIETEAETEADSSNESENESSEQEVSGDRLSTSGNPIADIGSEFTRWDKISTNLIDRFHALNKAQASIDNVTEAQDADTAVTLYPGAARARMDELTEDHTDPLIDLINKSGYTFEQLGEYLHARHATEANAVLKKRNPDLSDNERLSGMTDSEAAKVLSEFESKPELKEIIDRIDTITSDRVKQLVSDELITQDEANAWNASYDHYVPLNRLEVPDSLPGRGSGFDIRGKESKFRAGSLKDVDHKNMIARIIAQSEASMVRAEKNKVAQALYNLADANKDSDLWTTVVGDMPSVAGQRADGTAFYTPNLNDNNVIALKVDGETKYIYMNPSNAYSNQIAISFKNLNGSDIGWITKQLLSVNRYLAAINTSLSPEFVISNFFRDAQTAAYNLTDTQIDGMQKKMLKDIPKAMKGIRSALRGDGSADYAPIFKEFRKSGAMTGWMQSYDSAENRMEAIQTEISRKTTPGKKQIFQALKFIEDYNGVVENAVRLSAYKNSIDAGLSKQQAAKLAKQLTVDFNRKGEWASVANAMYLFYNASIQGTARMIRAIANPKNKKLHAMLLATVGFAAAMDTLNRMFGGEDEDGEKFYDKLPGHVRDRNLVIMNFFEDDGTYIKIPLPWGYNVFHIMGQEASGAVNKAYGLNPEYSAAKSAARLMASTLQSFNPVQDGSVGQTVSPTITDPLIRVSENKDWHGGPLMPDYGNGPDYKKFYSGARKTSVKIAEWMAESSMDKETLKPFIDVSPETIDMLYDFVTGSTGRVIADTYGTTSKIVTGNTEELEVKRVPVLRKVVGTVSRSDKQRSFYDAYYGIIDMDTQLRTRKGDPDYKDYLDGVGDRVKLIGPAKSTRKLMTKLKKRKKVFKERGDKKAVEKIDNQIDAVMNRFMITYRETIYKS